MTSLTGFLDVPFAEINRPTSIERILDAEEYNSLTNGVS
jgi:hypothetical protein